MTDKGQRVRCRLLNLISTPVAMLNGLGLDVAIGLSSEDPKEGRHPSEPYDVFLTMYGPDGRFAGRLFLGEVLPRRRRWFEVGRLGRERFGKENHLAVVHRIPKRLLPRGRDPEDEVELSPSEADYDIFRSVVQYSVPGGGSGAVIYETPPGLNAPRPGRARGSTLTFTSKVVLAEATTTFLVLIHYSVDPSYDGVAEYTYSFFAPNGERVATGSRRIGPFAVDVIDAGACIPSTVVHRHTDPTDGLGCFGYVGYASNAVLIPLVLNVSAAGGAVAVEHTHPAQTYTVPELPQDKHKIKARALEQWKSILGSPEAVRARS